MKTIMSGHDSSFSFSRRYFHWKKKPFEEDNDTDQEREREEEKEILNHRTSFSHFQDQDQDPPRKNKTPHFSRSKLKSALTLPFTKRPPSLGTRVVGTLFGHRRGNVRLAFQEDPKLGPGFLLELPTPTSLLVREMASGLVRIALECDRPNKGSGKLLEEPLWRSYCNGRKCGYANRRQCGPEERAVLRAVEPISMGAGVLPVVNGGVSEEGEVMYMRARYERVVGSKDSEAFYMMNPDGTHAGPELSIYFIRV